MNIGIIGPGPVMWCCINRY